jgi:hypothetical protein
MSENTLHGQSPQGWPQSIQSLIWGKNGPEYPAPYDTVFATLASMIAEYYRRKMWDPWTAIKHPWYLARGVGLRAWSQVEANLWLPFQDTYTLREYNTTILAGRLRLSHGDTLSDQGLMAFWTDASLSKGGKEFDIALIKELRLKPMEINVVHRVFCLFWDRHTPPLEFWSHPPSVTLLNYVLQEKGLSAQVTEESLKKLALRLNLRKSPHTIVRWSHSEGPGILDFDVDAAKAVGLPTGSESGLDKVIDN